MNLIIFVLHKQNNNELKKKGEKTRRLYRSPEIEKNNLKEKYILLFYYLYMCNY